MKPNLSTGGGDFTPFIKYNAKAGRWFVRHNERDAEIPNPTFAIDLANIRTGWIHFPQSGAPNLIWDVEGVRAPKPSPNHKDGFEVFLFGNDPMPVLDGQPVGIRQWMSNAGTAKAAILDAWAQYEQAKQNDDIPIFECAGVEIVPSAYGDNFQPKLVLKGWVGRAQVPEFDEAVAHRTPSDVAAPQQEMPPLGPQGDPGPQSADDYGSRW